MSIDQRIQVEALESYSSSKIDSQVTSLANKIGNKCKGCNRSFCSFSDLKMHIKVIHLKLKRFRCKICNYATFYKKGIFVHINTHGMNSALKKPNSYKNRYLNRNQVFDSQNTESDPKKLIAYKKYLYRTNKSQCHICKRILRGRYTVNSHIRAVHLKVKPHKCSLCNYSAFSSSIVRKHMRVHAKSVTNNEGEAGSSSQAENLEDSLVSDEVNFYFALLLENSFLKCILSFQKINFLHFSLINVSFFY